jgi:hypothetical protein
VSNTLDNAITEWLDAVNKATLAERLAIPTHTDPDVPATLPEHTFPSEDTDYALGGGTLDTTLASARTAYQSASQALAMAAMAKESGDLKGAGNLILTAAQELKNCESSLIRATQVDMTNRTAFANDAFQIGEIATKLFDQANDLLEEARSKRVELVGIAQAEGAYAHTFAKATEIDLDALRGHEFFAKSAGIPELWTSDNANLGAVPIHLHYYNANADFYVAELDEVTKTAWGYARASGETVGKWGAFSLSDLADYGKNASNEADLWKSGGPVERDESWTPTPAGQIPKIVIG